MKIQKYYLIPFKKMDDTYYVYEDDNNELYYYSCKTKEATYDKPENKIFLDPETNEPYVFPDEKKTKEKENDNKVEDENIKKQEEQQQQSPEKSLQKSESDQEATPKKSKKSKKPKKSDTESEKEQEKHKKAKKSDTDSEKEQEKTKKKSKKSKKTRRKSDIESEPDSEQIEELPIFYVYFDDNKKAYYYYNTITQDTTYDKPEKAQFLDPETDKPYVFDDKINQASNQDNDEEKDEDSEPKENKITYFVYLDEEKNTYYYFNPDTKESTYDKPEDAEFLDPDTNKPFVFNEKEKNTKEQNSQKSDTESDKETPKKTKTTKKSESELSSDSESNHESDENLETYFVYHNKNKIYYYNAETKESTYTKPKNAKFLDPSTSQPYIFTEAEKAEIKKKKSKDKKDKRQQENEQLPSAIKSNEPKEVKARQKHARFSDSLADLPQPKARSDTLPMKKQKNRSTIDLDMVIDVPRSVSKFEYTPEVKRPRSQSFLPDTSNLALPANLQQDIHKFQVGAYAKQFFKEHRTHHLFSRKKISPEVLASFQDTPLSASLLSTIPKNLQKESIQCFNYILNYSGATKDKIKNTSLNSLVSLIDQNVILRDEVYFQLIKQTNNNPNEDCLLRTWQIFVVIASIFPSSLDSEVWIKSHLSREAMVQKNKTISDYAQFTYIRFSARCTLEKPLEVVSPLVINRLIKDVYESKLVFHASIYEQLWNQRTTHKLFPVPITVHLMAEMLLQKGAEKTEGIFRIVGNKKVVINMQEKVNKGGEIDPNISIHDLASLFKSWFATLPDTLVPISLMPDLITASEDKTFIKFIDKMPKAHLYTLKYLIGFFQKLKDSESVTLMGASNLAICFGPDVISTRHVKEFKDFEKFKDISCNFLTTLINELPTGDVYPLDLSLV